MCCVWDYKYIYRNPTDIRCEYCCTRTRTGIPGIPGIYIYTIYIYIYI